jgi:glycosyltransferase involved in cell wall biosynthesis
MHNESQLVRPNTFFVAYRYGNHAGTSGYDRFADYLGESIIVSPQLRKLGDTVLRIPAKLTSWTCGSYEYSRHDAIQELAVRMHMGRHRNAIYHFLYAEKSLRFLGGCNRWRGHRIVGSFHHCAFKYPLYFKSTKHFSRIEHAVVVSNVQMEHMEKILGKGRVSFIPYAVDANYFQPAERQGNRKMRCTCVGQHLRDYESLEKIVRRVTATIPNVEFYVVGANSKFNYLSEVPGIVYKRNVPDEEYREILQQTDLLVLPLLDSTSVTTVNESLACGIPILTNFGGVSDYLNDDCGMQFRVGDVDAMASAVIELLRDEATRQQMARAARAQGLALHWPNSASQMRAVYDSLH